jgi:hypothetical protein
LKKEKRKKLSQSSRCALVAEHILLIALKGKRDSHHISELFRAKYNAYLVTCYATVAILSQKPCQSPTFPLFCELIVVFRMGDSLSEDM